MATESTKKSAFEILNAVNCNGHTEQKNGLTYLSWAWAWQIVKSYFPAAFYTVYETPEGRPYFDDGRTCWVKTGVTIEGLEHIEYLPVMDYNNRSIPVDKVTSMDMNKAIQRSLTKACARHGLGLYIYAGEDLPTEEAEQKAAEKKAADEAKKAEVARTAEARKKAARKPAPAPVQEPEKKAGELDTETYWKIVEATALGKKSKSGGDYRTEFIRFTQADDDLIAKFDHDVENVRAARGINILDQ